MSGQLWIGLLLGLAVGLGLGHLLGGVAPQGASGPQDVEQLRAHVADLEARLEAAGPGLDTGTETPPSGTADAPPSDANGGGIEGSELTSAWIQRRIQEVAEEIRRRGREAVEHAEAAARSRVEAAVREERARREDLARDGTMAWLRQLKQAWHPPFELASDPEKMGALFARKHTGATLRGDTFDASSTLADGDTIVFGPGVHALDVEAWNERDPPPQDVVIEGGGMDETLLYLRGAAFRGQDVHSLNFRDLTVHCSGLALTETYRGGFTIRAERCRFIGFDNDLLRGAVGAFYATDCRIESIHGPSPGFCNLFDVRGAFVARLEDCVVVGPYTSIYQLNGAVQVFASCRFEKLPWTLETQMKAFRSTAVRAVRFEDCTFQFDAKDVATHPQPRPVTDINPAWK